MLEKNFPSWKDNWRAEGEAIGLEKGEAIGEARGEARGETKGRRELLVTVVRECHGDRVAAAIAPALDAVVSPAVLDEIGIWVIRHRTAEVLLEKVQAL